MHAFLPRLHPRIFSHREGKRGGFTSARYIEATGASGHLGVGACALLERRLNTSTSRFHHHLAFHMIFHPASNEEEEQGAESRDFFTPLSYDFCFWRLFLQFSTLVVISAAVGSRSPRHCSEDILLDFLFLRLSELVDGWSSSSTWELLAWPRRSRISLCLVSSFSPKPQISVS